MIYFYLNCVVFRATRGTPHNMIDMYMLPQLAAHPQRRISGSRTAGAGAAALHCDC